VVHSDDIAKSKNDKDGNASGAEKHALNLEEAGCKSLFTDIISLL
jgi:hypothetical protein